MSLTALLVPNVGVPANAGIDKNQRIVGGGANKMLLRVMKLTAIILLSACITASATGHTQGITIAEKNAPLEKLFKSIEKQSGYTFFFNYAWLRDAKKVSVNVKNGAMKEVLDIIFKDQPFSYEIVNKTIVVKQKVESPNAEGVTLSVVEGPPPIDVKGRIVNENGEPVLASVQVKGTNKGTSTNADGYFELKNVDDDATLVITASNIETRELKLNGNGDLNVVNVKMKNSPLDEMQVIAYGTKSKRFQTGSVSSIKSEDIEKQPINNPLLALEGRMPGVYVTQSTGIAGGAVNIQIRGINSISSGSDPLYIIDGVPYASQLLQNLGNNILQQTRGNTGAGNTLSFINPSDIESISILKDADATAIYGSRGANGVVLITTKKGRIGDARVNVNVSTGIGKVNRTYDLMNTEQYLKMRREAFKNDVVIPTAANAPDLLVWDTTKYTDWQKLLIGGTAHYTNAEASVSGGSITSQYLVGATYHKETTVFPTEFSDQKGAIHFNLNSATNNQKFKLVLSTNYLVDDNAILNTDLTSRIYIAPNSPDVYNSDGTLNWANSTWSNPLAATLLKYNVHTNNLISNLRLTYEILNGLQLASSFGYTNMQTKEISSTPIASLNPSSSTKTGSASFTNNNIQSWIIEPQLTYVKNIGKSKCNFLLGSTFQKNESEGQIIQVTGYTSDALLTNMQAGPNKIFPSPTYSTYKYNAIFGRLNWTFENKYILNLTARRDGSSRFGDNNKFHNFGSIGTAWIFSDESFVKKIPFLSFGKIRASYGTTGNDQFDDYTYYDLFNSGTYTYQGTVPLTPTNPNNPNIQWEETRKMEVGANLGFFEDRILIDANYYYNRSSNQILSIPLPATTGFTSITTNLPATIQNNGWEISLNSVNVKSKNLTWTSSFNITIPKNKLVSYPNLDKSSARFFFVEGQPLQIIKAFHFLGINDTTGVYQFSDSKGSPTYSPVFGTDDYTVINTLPELYGGYNNSFSYKNFQLDFLFQFTKQMAADPLFQQNLSPGFLSVNVSPTNLNRWQNLGNEASIEKFTQSSTSSAYKSYQNVKKSDYVYLDASFIRLKNVAVSYIVKGDIVKKAKIQNCRLYLNAQNLLTITKYKGADPENKNINVLPPLRLITAGLEMSF